MGVIGGNKAVLSEIASLLIDYAEVEASKTVLRVYNGTLKLLNGGLSKFEPTPSQLHLEQGIFTLRRFFQDKKDTRRIPIILIPPLMVKPEVYDLSPERSFVRFLLKRGYDVFLMDFGIPTARDEGTNFDDYTKFIDTSVKKVKNITKSHDVSLIGYCMGGVFANIYAALDQGGTVRNIIGLGVPSDFSTMKVYNVIARVTYDTFDSIAENLGYIPPALPRTIFQVLSPIQTITRPFELWWNLWDEKYLASYEAVERWFNDFVGLPKVAFRQFFGGLICENQLFKGELKVTGKKIDLKKIKASYLALAGKNDNLVDPASVAPLIDVISSKDKRFEIVKGGHLGVLFGSSAPKNWEKIDHWLRPRSAKRKEV